MLITISYLDFYKEKLLDVVVDFSTDYNLAFLSYPGSMNYAYSGGYMFNGYPMWQAYIIAFEDDNTNFNLVSVGMLIPVSF